MAIYKYSTYSAASTTTFTGIAGPSNTTPAFTTADSFIFDDETIAASDLVIDVTTPTSPKLTIGGKAFVFTGFDITKISTTNFIFADGSKLQIGDGAIGITADDSANTITGTEYDDYLDGLGGPDTVSYASASSGITVDLTTSAAQDTLGAGVDKILNIENIIGSAFNDTLTGTTGNNTLNGGAGIDNLNGGAGNDTYIVTAGDTITELSGTIDTVQSSADWTLGTGLENLTLQSGAINGTGNSAANTLTGNTANNVLDGAGAGTLIDGLKDTLVGGAGNDTYIVHDGDEDINDVSGTDTVISTATFTLATNVENLRLLGSSDLNGTGNTSANIIYANKGTDTVSYQYGATRGVTVSLAEALAGVVQTTVGSGSDTLSNFEKLIGSSYGDKLTAATAVNTLDGGAGNDTLTGSGFNDTLIGGAGNDTFVVDAAIAATAVIGSVYGISDTAGTDTIKASATVSISALTSIENITLTGAGLTATGNTLANTLTSSGAVAGNTLVGGAGNDTYVVSKGDEVITELSTVGSGTDTVISTATFNLTTNALNVENLTLTGSGNINATGNSLANIIIGNSGNNILDGGAGNDNMSGGAGNDTYVVDSSADIVTEVAGAGATEALKASANGIDTVNSSINTTLGTNIENLTLLSGAINGTGNSLNNIITGNSSNNTLDGKLGNDDMRGGLGNDTYIVDSSADIVTEAASAGTDTVKSSATYIIGDNVENLTLTGSSAINGTGNASANILTGNTANNTLVGNGGADTFIGGAGKDTLTGGAGADKFVYNFASDSTVTSFDVITNFTTASDKIDVSAIFVGTDPTTLLTTAFTATGDAQVNYIGGKVSFDIDGDANADFAIALTGSPSLVIGDLFFG
jgi:Ca2+-binding RTX toxin-like protein